MLNRRTAQGFADFAKEGFPLLALDAVQLDLDEFVGLEGVIDLFQDSRREPMLAEAGDGIQMVSRSAERLAVFGSQFDHGAYFRM